MMSDRYYNKKVILLILIDIDILTSHNNLEQLKTITANVEEILKAGPFALKPCLFWAKWAERVQ